MECYQIFPTFAEPEGPYVCLHVNALKWEIKNEPVGYNTHFCRSWWEL